MGLLDDVAAWIAYYIVKPAVDSFKKHATHAEKVMAQYVDIRLRHFLYWVGSLNTTVSGYIKREIQKAVDAQESGTWDFFGWIGLIVDAVYDALEGFFVKAADLSNTILHIISNWWKTARETVLRTVKDTFVSIADFATDVTKIIVEFGYETFSVIITTVGNMISTAVEVVATTVANIAESVATSISNIIDSVATAAAKIQDALTDLAVKVAEDIAETVGDINETIANSIDELFKLIEEKVPGWVEALFEWAKPMVSDLENATDDLRWITNLLKEEAPMPLEWQRVRDENNLILEDVKDILKAVKWR